MITFITFVWSLIKQAMSGVIQGFGYWWELFRSLFDIGDYNIMGGNIVVGPGLQEIEIMVDVPNPVAVYLSASEPTDSVTTCVGDLNWVAARMIPGGFVLYANIASSSCTINYVVQY